MGKGKQRRLNYFCMFKFNYDGGAVGPWELNTYYLCGGRARHGDGIFPGCVPGLQLCATSRSGAPNEEKHKRLSAIYHSSLGARRLQHSKKSSRKCDKGIGSWKTGRRNRAGHGGGIVVIGIEGLITEYKENSLTEFIQIIAGIPMRKSMIYFRMFD